MPGIPFILRQIIESAARMTWQVATVGMALHFLIAWAVLALAGESFAKSPVDLIYFYLTTGTTVGYGDISPETGAGRLVTVFWIMPGAIAGVAWLLGRIVSAWATALRKAATGMANFESRKGHNVFIGYLPGQTETLIAETAKGRDRSILVAVQDLENRLPEDLDWVRATSLSDQEALKRAGVAGAERVVVMTGDDDATTPVCLALAGDYPKAPVVALFNERHKADLVSKACPSIRSVVAPASLLLARAACSQHAERVVDVLLSSNVDAALRTAVFLGSPSGAMSFRHLQAQITHFTDAVPIGVTLPDSGAIDLAPHRELAVHGGTLIHYVGASDYAGFDHEGRGVSK